MNRTIVPESLLLGYIGRNPALLIDPPLEESGKRKVHASKIPLIPSIFTCICKM
jgi:hypothetical protein